MVLITQESEVKAINQQEYQEIKSLQISSVSMVALGRVIKQLRNGNIIHSNTTVERLLYLSEEFQKAEVENYERNIGRTVNEVLG